MGLSNDSMDAPKKNSLQIKGVQLTITNYSENFCTIELIDKKKILKNSDLIAFLFFVFSAIYSYLWVEKFFNVVLLLFLSSLPASLVVIEQRNYTVREEILVLKCHGIQINSYKRSDNPFKTEFVEWDRVEDVLINEGIKYYKYFYYLVIVTKDKNGGPRLIVPFDTFNARVEILIQIWRELKKSFGRT